jgi:hypothetical protein
LECPLGAHSGQNQTFDTAVGKIILIPVNVRGLKLPQM